MRLPGRSALGGKKLSSSLTPPPDPHGLAALDYNEKRLHPRPEDMDYLAMADLRRGLEELRLPEAFRILDYGAGGSPYRSLFPGADYKRADCVQLPGLDYVFGSDEKIQEKDGAFDLILSTQVLEHVRHPQLYLREAHRLLRSGGRILVSTHGLFEEHGAPVDYRRWTLEGLFAELEDAGFRRGRGWKLTVGPRALLFWLLRHVWAGRPTWKSSFGLGWNLLRGLLLRYSACIHRCADRHFGQYSVVSGDRETSPIYIGVLAEGLK